jgi:DNA integrity scanning protein DisA with diadenylate cyclase activity
MNQQNNRKVLSEEARFKELVEDLKGRLIHLYTFLPRLGQCSHLSTLLGEVFELRKELSQLEQGMLQSHLKCCISPGTRIPGEVVLAASKLSARRHGAIIVIEQESDLDDCIQSGVIIDALVSAPILENIFYPGSRLHDGAAVIRNDRIIKAGCFLPFSSSTSGIESSGLGARHMAAVGLSNVSDALVVVVSEEKGWISLALRGQLYPNIGTFALLKKLGIHSEVDTGHFVKSPGLPLEPGEAKAK